MNKTSPELIIEVSSAAHYIHSPHSPISSHHEKIELCDFGSCDGNHIFFFNKIYAVAKPNVKEIVKCDYHGLSSLCLVRA